MANSKVAEHHKKAADHYENATKHHRKAQEHYSKNEHEKGSYHSTSAQGFANKGRKSADEATETHSDTHGDDKK